MGKVTLCKLLQKLKFDLTTKWYMRKSESVLENEIHKVIWDFEIQTNHLIPVKRPDLKIVKKKRKITWRIVDFAVQANHRVKIVKNEKRDKYSDFA